PERATARDPAGTRTFEPDGEPSFKTLTLSPGCGRRRQHLHRSRPSGGRGPGGDSGADRDRAQGTVSPARRGTDRARELAPASRGSVRGRRNPAPALPGRAAATGRATRHPDSWAREGPLLLPPRARAGSSLLLRPGRRRRERRLRFIPPEYHEDPARRYPPSATLVPHPIAFLHPTRYPGAPMRTLSLIQVGGGIWGRGWAELVHRTHGFRLEALVDASAKVRRWAAVDLRVPVFGDLEQALERTAAGAVLLISPPKTHRPLAELAMAQGLHVLTEKPLTLALDDACALVKLSERTGPHAMIS